MSLEYSLCHKSFVYVPTLLFMSLESVNVPRVQFMSQVHSLCSHIKVYDTTVQIMSLEYSLCP